MEPVEAVRVQTDAEFMGDGGKVQERIGGAGNCCVDHHRVFKGFFCNDVGGRKPHPGQTHGLSARLHRSVLQAVFRSGQECRSRKGKPQRFRHDLHGGGGSHEGAGAAGGAGMGLIKKKLLFTDFAPFIHGAVGPDLLQRQKIRSCVHDAAGKDDAGNIDPARRHQMRRHAFVTARDINGSVEGRGAGMNLDHICHHVPGGQGIVHPVMALRLPVADVRTEVSRAESSFQCGARPGLFRQLQQMDAARMAVPKGAFNENLRLCQILPLPSRTQPERVQLRRLFS